MFFCWKLIDVINFLGWVQNCYREVKFLSEACFYYFFACDNSGRFRTAKFLRFLQKYKNFSLRLNAESAAPIKFLVLRL